MIAEDHLSFHEYEISAGAEKHITPAGWCLLRLHHGAAYCLEPKTARELASGDVICVPPRAGVLLRASRIGSACFQYFYFQPAQLHALLTLSERQAFEAIASAERPETRHFPADDPIARQFEIISAHAGGGNRLLERAHMLALVAAMFAPILESGPARNGVASAPSRFLELVRQIPEIEMLTLSPGDLARRCGCSVRHFTRLFRGHFGVSIHARQTQLRLEKARQLLCETDARVSDIALDSGYRHLGLFTAVFKKHFGVTPSEVRRSKIILPPAITVAGGAYISTSVHSANHPEMNGSRLPVAQRLQPNPQL
jgi:AraC-like DNA-binding protein